ncbi:hypothetical protein MKY41_01635 [Sporosarcina sp. FSL W7-1349]|uniref:hypothetical protein n=1 Tax=Sporosarcina sp. FSL W7-1349 TaxID=2921561 RepID=UPI0030F58D73
MKTKVTTVDGKVHLVHGHPEDFMQQIGGVGVSREQSLTSVTAEKIKMADIMMMQIAKE